MVGTKSRCYSNSGRLTEGEYSRPFFSTDPSPSYYNVYTITLIIKLLQIYEIRVHINTVLPNYFN